MVPLVPIASSSGREESLQVAVEPGIQAREPTNYNRRRPRRGGCRLGVWLGGRRNSDADRWHGRALGFLGCAPRTEGRGPSPSRSGGLVALSEPGPPRRAPPVWKPHLRVP